uniref:B box-type domain-containing protein n=1 Tax=Timema douglasi TaxID=61478 RepID=A0A7R8ZHA3_TIMDO|nr:unnamed protein product [Timema douglasi]
MCPSHPDHELELFCGPCCQVVCHECSLYTHKGHLCEPAARVAHVYTSRVKEAVERARPLAEQAAVSLERLKVMEHRIEVGWMQVGQDVGITVSDVLNTTRLKVIGTPDRGRLDAGRTGPRYPGLGPTEYNTSLCQVRCSQVQAEVQRFVELYMSALEEHGRSLQLQVQQARETKLQNLHSQQLNLQRCGEDARTAVRFAEDLLTDGSQIEVQLSHLYICERRGVTPLHM